LETNNDEGLTYYVYVYHDPERNCPMYVGKGCGGRFKKHLKNATNIRFKNRLTTLTKLNLKPVIKVEYFGCEDTAMREEVRLIKLYGRKDLNLGSLYNMTDGGEGSSGWKPSEITKKRIGDKNKNPSPETLLKQSSWVRSDELKKKISVAQSAAQLRMSEEEKLERSRLRSKECLAIETRKRMSDSAKARPPLTCPHCGKIGKAPGIRRHHFEYCKSLIKA
jgi:hypothetical protein